MSRVEIGNWNEGPREPVRRGVERVVLAPGANLTNCSIHIVENGHEVRPRTHPYEQIMLLLQGECDYYINGKPYRLKAGSWITIPPNVEHYIHAFDSKEPCLQMDIFPPIHAKTKQAEPAGSGPQKRTSPKIKGYAVGKQKVKQLCCKHSRRDIAQK